MKNFLGSLYFLQVAPDGPVKIGWTQGCVTNRIRSLQAASPHVLKWIGACRAAAPEEKAAHQELSAHQVRGEWFAPTAEVLAFVASRSGDFNEVEYLERHHGLSIMARYKKLTAGDRKRAAQTRERIEAEARLNVYRWLSMTTTPRPSTLEQLNASISIIERERAAQPAQEGAGR